MCPGCPPCSSLCGVPWQPVLDRHLSICLPLAPWLSGTKSPHHRLPGPATEMMQKNSVSINIFSAHPASSVSGVQSQGPPVAGLGQWVPASEVWVLQFCPGPAKPRRQVSSLASITSPGCWQQEELVHPGVSPCVSVLIPLCLGWSQGGGQPGLLGKGGPGGGGSVPLPRHSPTEPCVSSLPHSHTFLPGQ